MAPASWVRANPLPNFSAASWLGRVDSRCCSVRLTSSCATTTPHLAPPGADESHCSPAASHAKNPCGAEPLRLTKVRTPQSMPAYGLLRFVGAGPICRFARLAGLASAGHGLHRFLRVVLNVFDDVVDLPLAVLGDLVQSIGGLPQRGVGTGLCALGGGSRRGSSGPWRAGPNAPPGASAPGTAAHSAASVPLPANDFSGARRGLWGDRRGDCSTGGRVDGAVGETGHVSRSTQGTRRAYPGARQAIDAEQVRNRSPAG